MKNAKNLNAVVTLEHVGNSIVTVERLADFTVGYWLVALAQTRLGPQQLDLVVNP